MKKKPYFKDKEQTSLIRISAPSKTALKDLAEKRGLKQITTLEYLLRGRISIKELKYK